MAQEGRDESGKFKVKNLFALGNNGGRPPIYNTHEEIAIKIGEYLDYEDELRALGAKKEGKGVYTIEGCALFLGFCTRDSLYDYEKKSPEFSYVINRFRLFMTHVHAQKLNSGATFMGAQFWLKNWGGYKDEVTQNQNVATVIQPQVVSTDTPLANDESQVK
jgi:hypothetical protein